MAGESLAGRLTSGFPNDLVGDFDLAGVMTRVSERCVDVLDISAAAVMLLAPGGELRIAGSSTAYPPELPTTGLYWLDRPEPDRPPAPSLSAATDSAASSNIRAWPGPEEVVGFVHAVPMRGTARVVGAVLLFRDEASPLDNASVDAVGIMADIATVVVLQHRRQCADNDRQLGAALRARIMIEQAVGMIAEREGATPAQALDTLRDRAGGRHRMSAVAEAIVSGSVRRGSR